MFKFAKIAVSILLCLGLTPVVSLGDNSPAWTQQKSDFKYPEPSKIINGLKGEYYDTADFKNFKYTRTDTRISFDWEGGAPSQLGGDSFSVRWTGQVQPKYTENYTFHTIADDGVRLWVNNKLVISDWNNHAATEKQGSIRLDANKKYNIKLEYYEYKNDACVKLLWSSKRQEKEIIPGDRLFSETTVTPQPPKPNPPADSSQPVKVDLTAYYNEDAFSYDTRRGDGDFDGFGNSYSANLFTKNPVYDGVAYTTGPLDNGKDNSIRMEGQKISVKQGKYESIRLLGSATNGDQSGVVRVNYTDGSSARITLSMADWCTSDTSGEKVVQAMNHRHTQAGDDDFAAYVFAYYLSPDRNKTVSGITLPDQEDMHVLAITLLTDVRPYSGTGTGLAGTYFNNINFTSQKLSRIDATVNFDWGTGAPASQIDADTFSVRWSGQVEPRYSENYTFYTTADDGVRLWINNVLLIDDWNEHSATERSGAVTLTAGKKYNIKLEYFDNQQDASVKLMWSSPSQGKEIIPASQLYN